MIAVPSAVTMLGLLVGVLGVGTWSTHQGFAIAMLLTSIVFDCIDGWAARSLGVVSAWGAELDWTTDVALAHAIAWQCLGWPHLSCALVVWQSFARCRALRVSGRVLVTALAALSTVRL